MELASHVISPDTGTKKTKNVSYVHKVWFTITRETSVFARKEATWTQQLKNVWFALLHWDGIRPNTFVKHVHWTLTGINYRRAASVAQLKILFGTVPTASAVQQTLISIWFHSSVSHVQATWFSTKSLSSVSVLQRPHIFPAMDFVLAATGRDIGTSIRRLAINAPMELITMKNSECAILVPRTCPSGMDLFALGARQLSSSIKGRKNACLALAVWPSTSQLWNANAPITFLISQAEDAFHAIPQATGTPTPNNASHARPWHTTTALLESAWTAQSTPQSGMEQTVSAAQLELISTSLQDNVSHAPLALFLTSASWSASALLTLLTFKTALVLLVNIQEHGIQGRTNVFLLHAKRTSTGMWIPINAHGVLMQNLSGMAISALPVQLVLFTSRIITFAWLALLVRILTKPSSDAFALQMLLTCTITLVCHADTQLIGILKHWLVILALKD